jgi:hypothetical protein
LKFDGPPIRVGVQPLDQGFSVLMGIELPPTIDAQDDSVSTLVTLVLLDLLELFWGKEIPEP